VKVSLHAAQAFLTPFAGRGSALALPSRYAPGTDARFQCGRLHQQSCSSVVICFAFIVVSPSFLVMKDPMEVCPLSRGVMFQLLSTSLRGGFRFFHHPIPTIPSAFLTVSFPLRENDGLTTFRIRTQNGLGSACSPVAFHLRVGKGKPVHLATYLLVQAYFVQHLWLVGSHDVCQRFTYVSHTIRPWPPTTSVLVVAIVSRD
jgi:hypothetical protein